MKLEGIHHISSITGRAAANVDFYTRVLGLRLVKKTVNQDDPTVYHLFYADERGSAGADLTFFEYPGIAPGRAGAGMIHRIVLRVGSESALDFWEGRLEAEGLSVDRAGRGLRFDDPEGLGFELAIVEGPDVPLVAQHPAIPSGLALQGFEGVRAYAHVSEASRPFLEEALAFEPVGDGWEARGKNRGSTYVHDQAPSEAGLGGAGTIHHVAWSSSQNEHEAWRRRVVDAGAHPTEIIDRYYFRSIYFREPSGVLFEIATLGPGFAVDEPIERLGESLALPPRFEPLREQLEQVLTPLPNPRSGVPAT